MKTVVMGLGSVLQIWAEGEKELSTMQVAKGWVISLGTIWIIVWSCIFLWSNKDKMELEYVKNKIGNFYTEINPKSNWGHYYFPALFLRFLVYVLISSLLYA